MRKSKRGTAFIRTLAVLVLLVSTGTAAVLGWLAFSEQNERKKSAEFYEKVAAGKSDFRVRPTQPTIAEPEDVTLPYEEPSLPAEEPEQPTETIPTPTEQQPIPETTAELPETAAQPETESNSIEETLEILKPTEETAPTEPEQIFWDTWCDDHKHIQTGTESSELDFEEVQKVYPDCYGWVEIPGLDLDMPIVQGEDNEFYLNHLPTKEYSPSGSIMMDTVCRSDFHSDMTFLHAHCMKNGSMFGSLTKYANVNFYQEYPSYRLYTPDGDYQVDVIGAFTVDGVHFGYPDMFETEEEMTEFLDSCRRGCPYQTDVTAQWGDRLLILSTCAYDFTTQRFLVVGVIR